MKELTIEELKQMLPGNKLGNQRKGEKCDAGNQ